MPRSMTFERDDVKSITIEQMRIILERYGFEEDRQDYRDPTRTHYAKGGLHYVEVPCLTHFVDYPESVARIINTICRANPDAWPELVRLEMLAEGQGNTCDSARQAHRVTAMELLRCCYAWEPQATSFGNVTFGATAAMLTYFLIRELEPEPEQEEDNP
jgi:hypothetical protein